MEKAILGKENDEPSGWEGTELDGRVFSRVSGIEGWMFSTAEAGHPSQTCLDLMMPAVRSSGTYSSKCGGR